MFFYQHCRSALRVTALVFAVGAASLIPHLLSAQTTASQAAAPASRPNILLILADDMGYSDIGAFGGEIKTPNIDKLADGGKIFTQFYNTARCCPSRAALMTGLYSHQAGIGHLIYKTPYVGYGDHLTSDSTTIAEVLHSAGYGTYMVGKWHLAPRSYHPVKDRKYWPTRRGFDKFYGTINGSGSFYDPSTLTRDDKFISPEADPLYKPREFYYTDALTDNAVMYLKQHHSKSKDKPFFMYLAYTASHWPLQAPADAIAPYRGKYDEGYEAVRAARLARMRESGLVPGVGDVAPPVGNWASVKDKKHEAALMETYAAMASRMDAGIGKVLEQLRVSGQLDNTLVIYLQDNGACAEDPFAKPRPEREPIAAMKPREIQESAQPAYTRQGKPIRTGHDVEPGPAEGLTAYLEAWANVSNTPFREYKHFVHEGGISTPLIAYWPAGIHPTSSTKYIRTPAHLIDVMPTLLELAEANYPERRQGVRLQLGQGISLASTLTDDSTIQRGEPLFWEHEGNRAVRDGKWKIVAISEKGPWELYDMETDRGEVTDLAQKHPEIVKRMAGQWDAWAARSRVLPLGGWRERLPMEAQPDGVSSVTLKQGETRSVKKSLGLRDHGITVETEVLGGPVEGVLVAQGASFNGFTLYAQDELLVFAATINKTLHQISLPLPPVPFKVTATLNDEGTATLKVGEKSISGDFGPDLFGSMPSQGISAGLDSGTPVAPYGLEFPFKGKLGTVHAHIYKP